MGNAQSNHAGAKGAVLRNDSSLEFDPSKKIKTESMCTAPDVFSKKDSYESFIEYQDTLLTVQDDGGTGFIPELIENVKKKMTVPVVFRWEYGGKEVYISGSFNEWKSRIPMTFSGGEFTTIIELPKGEHEFKYLVDGHWIHDPSQKTVDDKFNGRNNVTVVSETDFDATEALLSDECSTGGTSDLSNRSSSVSLSRLSPPGSYSNLMPHTSMGTDSMDGITNMTAPPALPPHLLNIILNKDSYDEEDPTLLPLPNHVALNHLYALSIKDSVMTMSATHRYKRKYITTLYYKPIKIS